MNDAEGFLKGDVCNRNGCDGIIDEHEKDGSCSCHINPPCSYCEHDASYCPKCDWSAAEDQKASYTISDSEKAYWEKQRNAWEESRKSFYEKYKSGQGIEKLEIRSESHTHFTMKVIGVFPTGSETKSSLLERVKGTFGGRFTKFNNHSFEYIAYTD